SIKYMNMHIKKMWSRHMVIKWTQTKDTNCIFI
ncbi:unnamed protein product, partial [Rotaria socialis]